MVHSISPAILWMVLDSNDGSVILSNEADCTDGCVYWQSACIDAKNGCYRFSIEGESDPDWGHDDWGWRNGGSDGDGRDLAIALSILPVDWYVMLDGKKINGSRDFAEQVLIGQCD